MPEPVVSGRARRIRRIAIAVFSIGLFLFAALWVLGAWAEKRIHRELATAASNVCASIDQVDSPLVSVSIFSRRVSITGLRLLPAIPCANAPVALHGMVDTLVVTGISFSDLLFGHTLAAEGMLVRTTGLSLTLRSDTGQVVSDTRSPRAATNVEFAAHDIRLASTVLVTLAEDTLRAGARLIETSGKGLYLRIAPDSSSITRCEQLHLLVDSLYASSSTGYEGSLARCVIDQEKGSFDVLQLDICPSESLEELGASLRYEGDVFAARLDTLHAEGMDVQRLLAEGVPSLRKVRFASADVTVLRDKTVQDEPWKFKPLLARLIRNFPPGSGADTITIAGLDVRYRERVDMGRGFALIPLSGIRGTVTGARNTPGDTSALNINARCIAFNETHVSLNLRTHVQDTTDRFDARASLGRLRFLELNPVTGPLVDIRATDGVMDSLIFRMTGYDHRATGLIRMNYAGLKVESGGRQRKETLERIKTALLNTMVRNEVGEGNTTYREGQFAFDRRRDRAIFNYLWSGLREGVKVVILPDLKAN